MQCLDTRDPMAQLLPYAHGITSLCKCILLHLDHETLQKCDIPSALVMTWKVCISGKLGLLHSSFVFATAGFLASVHVYSINCTEILQQGCVVVPPHMLASKSP